MAEFALEQLGRLESGDAELTDSRLSISGTASTLDAYDALVASISDGLPDGLETGALELSPPVMSPYVWRAELGNGNLLLDGYAPDIATRDAIVEAARAALPQAAVQSQLRIATGAPETFKSATEFALSFLPQFIDGMARLEDRKVSISGTSKSAVAFQKTAAMIDKVPEGYEIADNGIRPQVAKLLKWSLAKDDAGVTVSGLAADRQAGDAIIEMVRQATGASVVIDQHTFASGEPESFQKAREFATGQVKLLDTGVAIINGKQISISGKVGDAETLGLLERAVNLRVPEGYESKLDVSTPDSVIIKGKEVKLDSSEVKDEPEFTPRQVCQNDMVASIDGRKIRFESGRAIIKKGSTTILDSVLIAVKRSCEKFPIEIGGHTDSDGGKAYNQKLSEARAASVAKYLLSKGMDEGRLSIVGFGETQPIADNGTREGKAINRRIEFKVLN